MAHDLLKIGLTLVVLGLVVAAMALMVSGYLSAYKPGGKGVQTPASAVSGSKSLSRAAPSPTVNASMRPFSGYPQYMPPGPVMPQPEQLAPMPMPMVEMQPPPSGWPSPSPSVAPARPISGVPAVPSAPGISGIIQVLFRLLPLIFSHHYDLTPIWPQLNR